MMDHNENDWKRVRELIRAYGPSPNRWPPQDQHLAASIEDGLVSALVREEQVLDDILNSYKVPVPSQEIMNTVLTIPTGSLSSKSNSFVLGLWPFRAAWQPASVATLALVVGIAAGQITQLPAESRSDTSSVAALGLDEEITIAMGTFAMGEFYIVTVGEQ